MAEVAKAFCGVAERTGQVIGVLPAEKPCATDEERGQYHPPTGYPNEFIEIAIRTHLPLSGARGMDQASRNHIVVLTSNLIVALPGSSGTRSEIWLALEYEKPLVILNREGAWNEFRQTSATLVDSVEAVFRAVSERLANA